MHFTRRDEWIFSAGYISALVTIPLAAAAGFWLGQNLALYVFEQIDSKDI